MSGNDITQDPSPSPDRGDAPTLRPDAPREEAQSIPASFGDYELIDEIARGGMGVVYKARQVSLNRVVALKMILSGQFASENDVRRFRQEAESAATLDHSGIVPIYEIGEHAGHHFFSMKLIVGGSLSDRMEEINSQPRLAAKLIADVGRAVHHAHQRGILHRDLKPANILLDQSGNPLVSDLGLAKDIRSDSNLTHTGAIVGTPAYMPPEQAAAKKEITTAADIYSIGAMLYEALTGKPPHEGDTPLETLLKVTEKPVTPPRELDSTIDRTLELICMKCLRREPDERYASAAALADDLESWLNNEPVSVRPPSFSENLGVILRSNLKSAFGAALISAGVGVMFATFWMFNVARHENFGSAPEVYASFPSESQPEFFLRANEMATSAPSNIGTLGILLAVFLIIYLGLIITWLIRPKPGSPALAIGVVSGLVLNTFVFGSLGFNVMMAVTQGNVVDEVRQLSSAAVGTQDQRLEALEEIAKLHPDLDTIEASKRARLLGDKIGFDGALAVPWGLIAGILLSSIICLLPAIVGTSFASRLVSEEKPLWALILYTELAVSLILLVLTFFSNTARPALGVEGAKIGGNLLFYVLSGFACLACYRRWDWRLRLMLLVSWATALALWIQSGSG